MEPSLTQSRDGLKLLESVAVVIDYLWDDEANHYRSHDPESGPHIFDALAALADWLERQVDENNPLRASSPRSDTSLGEEGG